MLVVAEPPGQGVYLRSQSSGRIPCRHHPWLWHGRRTTDRSAVDILWTARARYSHPLSCPSLHHPNFCIIYRKPHPCQGSAPMSVSGPCPLIRPLQLGWLVGQADIGHWECPRRMWNRIDSESHHGTGFCNNTWLHLQVQNLRSTPDFRLHTYLLVYQ